MANNQRMQVIQARLGVAIDVRDDAAEDLWVICGVGAQLGVEVLKLDLLASEVLGEAAELAAGVFIAFFVVEGV